MKKQIGIEKMQRKTQILWGDWCRTWCVLNFNSCNFVQIVYIHIFSISQKKIDICYFLKLLKKKIIIIKKNFGPVKSKFDPSEPAYHIKSVYWRSKSESERIKNEILKNFGNKYFLVR